MGADIHLFAEARNDEGEWELVEEPITTCWSCKGSGLYTKETHPHLNADQLGGPCYWCAKVPEDEYDRSRHVEPGKVRESWFHDRNYIVFSILADVRNGISANPFIDDSPATGHYVIPIDDPRGFPEDLSDGGLKWLDIHGGDHSDSWLSLPEVFRFDWANTPVAYAGLVTPSEFRRFQLEGKPNDWYSGAWGSNIVKISNEEMDLKIRAGFFTIDLEADDWGGQRNMGLDGKQYYTNLRWTTPAGDAADHFLAAMKRLAMFVGERETRIVFNFDS